MKIVVIGSFMMDLVVTTSRAPMNGETIIGNSFNRYPGGKGANQAVTASRLGGNTTFIGKVGSDLFGKEAINTLSREKVNIDNLLIDDENPTGIGSVTLEESGNNRIIIVPGANLTYTIENLQSVKSIIKNAEVIILQLEINLQVVEKAIQYANHCNVPVILNPAPACALSNELLSKVTYLTPNESEAGILTNTSIKTLKDATKAANILIEKGVKNVIMTLGNQGALIVNKEETIHVPGYFAKQVDTVAAGDSFNGALAIGISKKKPLKEIVQYANAVGALTITKNGAIPSLPTKEEVDRFIKVSFLSTECKRVHFDC